MLNIPVIPAYRPDPVAVAAIRQFIANLKLASLRKAVTAARRVA